MIKIDIPEDMSVDERNFKMALAIIQLSEPYEPGELAKAFSLPYKDSIPLLDVNDIEEVAKHLMVYVDRVHKDKE